MRNFDVYQRRRDLAREIHRVYGEGVYKEFNLAQEKHVAVLSRYISLEQIRALRRAPTLGVPYPENKAVESWEIAGLSYHLVKSTSYYCGYVRFPRKPVREEGCGGLLIWVPVHGGLTYAAKKGPEMVYGFDCGHLDDEYDPKCRDRKWLRNECMKMGRAIKLARWLEPLYLLFGSRRWRAYVIELYLWVLHKKYGNELDVRDNFGAMIKLLGGKL